MNKTQIEEKELESIRSFTRKDIKAEEIYTFPLILCDNEIDRDNEKFTRESLEKLAKLFVGKTGIFDHSMKGSDQTARIYQAEVETDESRLTADGEPYTCVRAKAYMVRNSRTKDLIAEIDAGIKKETSVSCCVRNIKCSICGKDIKQEKCGHEKGAEYGGKTCCYLLCEPEDAYEWSFVAVPAQKNAGVTKSFTPGETEDWVRDYSEELTVKAVRSFAKIAPRVGTDLIREICAELPLRMLRDLSAALVLQEKAALPPVRQLARAAGEKAENNNEYKI